MASASPPTTRRAAQLLLQLARDHRRILGGAVLGGLGWQLAGIVVPVVIGWTIDRGIVEGDRQAIWLGVLAMVGLGAVEAGCAALRHWMACRADMAAGASVRLALTDAALRLDEDAADRFPPGEVIARETSDGATVAGLFDAVGHTVAEAISVPVITVVLLLIDPALGLVVGLLIPVSIVLMWRSSVVWERRSAKVQAAMGRAVSSAQESVEGFRTIRGIGAESAAVDRFVTRSASLRDRSVEMGNLWLAFEPALQLVTVAAEGLVLWIGGHRVIDGSVGIGEVVTAVGLVLFLSGPLRTLGERVLTVQGALASA
ncbi:MAG: ABC transporter transmembrane domain-containing protein, partial [Actinomycetota bacterium]|nr:ABC transporter transmembrane domain-containing protein [Actinomycetota bacterium]